MPGVLPLPTMEPTTDAIDRIKDLVYSRSHLSFPPSREAQLKRWLIQRTEEGGHDSLDAYYRVLVTNDQEFDRLLSLITTRETYFYRMPAQFRTLADRVLPAIVEREGREALRALSEGRTYRMTLRAWSAGCATGQETFSLAMQIVDGIRYAKAWDIEVLGTDINAEALAFARRARYDLLRMGHTPVEIMQRFFIPCADAGEKIMIAEEAREVTRFATVNLRHLDSMASFRNAFDIIFCRNVMIYFDLPAQQRLVTALTACLRPGGYLFTGEGEVLHLYEHDLLMIEEDDCIYYQRPERTE